MEHNFIDQYSDLDSLIHKLDPRTKLITTLAFITAVVVTPPDRWEAFAGYFVLIGSMLLLSKLPPLYVFKRALLILPFILLIGVFNIFKSGESVASFHVWHWQLSITSEGLLVFWDVFIKASLSILSLILLSSTTKFAHLLKGLEQLRMPRIMVMILSFMYRYIFVIIDEVMRMKRARDSRNFGGKRIWQIKTIGNMVGTLFLRSYERGERVYQSMVSRGYEGQIRTLDSLSFSQRDAYYNTAIFLLLLFIGLTTLFWQF